MRNKILNMKLEVKSYYLFFGVLLLSQLFEFGNGYDLADSKIESSLAKPDQESKITRFHENFPAIVYQREQLIVIILLDIFRLQQLMGNCGQLMMGVILNGLLNSL